MEKCMLPDKNGLLHAIINGRLLCPLVSKKGETIDVRFTG